MSSSSVIPRRLIPTAEETKKWSMMMERLIANRNNEQSLLESEIMDILRSVMPIMLLQPMMLEVEAPVIICGDIHGQMEDLIRLYDFMGWPIKNRYLFLGDYVDRGPRSIEVICLQYLLKLQYPRDFFILRGNHESFKINRVYGFREECRVRYNENMWKRFQHSFGCMPICALVSNRIFCMHGGISQELISWNQINRMKRPTDVPESGIICDLLWADPNHDSGGWEMSPRGVSWLFGEDAVQDFCQKHDIDMICRAHQVVQEGYEFFAKRRLVTIFTAPNYGGDFGNIASVIYVDKNLTCKIHQLKPKRG